MASKIYELKQKVLKEIPKGELPGTIFGRLMVKTRLIWSRIDENTTVTDEEFQRALKGAEDLFGKKFYI